MVKIIIDGVDKSNSEITSLTELSDVTITSVANDNLLQFNSTSGEWENVTFASFEGTIDHVNILNIGTNNHAQIDTHIALVNEHIDWINASDNLTTTGTIQAEQLTSTDDLTMLGHLMTLGNGTSAPIIKFDGFESDGEITYNPVTGSFGFDSSISVAGNATINGNILGIGDIDRTGEIKLITIPNDARFETINNSMEFEKANGGSWIMRFENSGAGGTLSNPVGCDNNQSIMNFQGRSTTGTAGGYRTVCRVQCRATEDHDFNGSALGTKMQFFTTPKQVAFDVNAMTLEDDGFLSLFNNIDSAITTDKVQIGGFDLSPGNRVFSLSQESPVVVETDETKFSNKLPVRINGTTYFIMLTTT